MIDNSLTSYFIFRGQLVGFEYEMLDLFARENDLTPEIRIVGQVEKILDSLLAGHGDLVATNLTISKKRLEKIAFTKHLFRTKQMLIQRLLENRSQMTRDQIERSLVRDMLDLDRKEIMVRRNSSYELMLNNLVEETGIDLTILHSPGNYIAEHLIDMVANKRIDLTICDHKK